MKSAQGAIKILLKSDFYSDLTHFVALIGGGGGGEPSQRDTGCPRESETPNLGRQ